MTHPVIERISEHFALTQTQGRWLCAVAVFGLMLSSFLAYLGNGVGTRLLVGDERYYLGIARDIASGMDPQFDWLWPQLYGQSLGWLFKLIGTDVVWVVVCQVVLGWLAGWVLFAFTYRVVNQQAALLTVSLYWLSPEIAAFSHYFWPEISHLFLMVSVWWLISRKPGGVLSGLVAGLLLGLALLSKLLLLPFVPVLFGFVLWLSPVAWPRRMAMMATMAIGCAVLVMPVIHYNEQHYGLRHIADSSQLNLYLGLTESQRLDYVGDRAPTLHAEFNQSGKTMAERNAVFKTKVTEEWARFHWLERLGTQLSVQYFRLFSVETFFTSQLPGGPRASYAFDSPFTSGILRISAIAWHLIILGLAPFGLMFVKWQRRTWLWLPLLWLLYNLGLFFWVHVKTRYLMQVQPSLIVFAAIGFYGLWRQRRRQPLPDWLQYTGWQLIGAAALAIWFWYCALGGLVLA